MTTQVLVFESDAAFAQELEVGLAEYDCQTTIVDDANAGLQAAANEKPDLILLSIELPRMNGFSVCNKLKRDASLKNVPLIIMSSDSTEETFEQHRRLRTRAEDYVHKPISVGDLVAHIQELLPLESNSEGEESIIIDDDIEIEDAEALDEIDDDIEIEEAEVSSPVREAPVDQEVDDFTEQAFGALMGGGPISTAPAAVQVEPSLKAPPVNDLELDDEEVEIGSLSEPPQQLKVAGGSAAPPQATGITEPESLRLPSTAPADGQAARRAAELEEQLSAAGERIAELENQVLAKKRADAEVERLDREVQELRQKLASGKSGGSAREFLDLREQLNSKDKEILELRDQLNHREKELLGLKDSSLGLEREKADLEDKVLEFERKITDLTRTSDALRDDKEQASKRADDYKRKAEKLKGELDAKAKQAEELASKHQDELLALENARTALTETHQRELEQLSSEAESRLNQAVEAARVEAHQEALEEAQRQAELQKTEALRQREAELKAEHDSKMAALHRANEESLGKLRAEQEQASQEASEAAARALREREEELKAELAQRVSELTQQKEAAEASRDAKIASLEADLDRLTQERDSARAAGLEREEANASLQAEVAELTQQRENAQATIIDQKQRIEALDAALSEQNEEFAELAARLQEREATIAALEADLAATRQHLNEATASIDSEKNKMDRARRKWNEDRASLERAKDALAVALAQLEETETRTLD